MKVLFIANDPLIFKEDSSVRARMREYASTFGELHILSRGTCYAEKVTDGALTLHAVQGSKISALLSMERLARRIISQENIEVVSAQDPFEHGFIALRAVRGTKAHLHVQIHTDFLSPYFSGFLNRVRVRIADFVLPRARGIRVVSKRIARSLEKRYGPRVVKASVIPITVSPDLPEPVSLPSHSFSFSFITIARLEKEKRIGDIIRALAKVVDVNTGLIIVGDGSERASLQQLAHNLGLNNRVVFTGWRTDSLGLLQNADAYIQASAYEGYGRTLVEASLANLPIITTDVGIVGDILENGGSALTAPVSNIEKLAEAMETVTNDKALSARLGENARTRANAHIASAGNLGEVVCADLARLVSGGPESGVH